MNFRCLTIILFRLELRIEQFTTPQGTKSSSEFTPAVNTHLDILIQIVLIRTGALLGTRYIHSVNACINDFTSNNTNYESL